jgi:PLP dependent protein
MTTISLDTIRARMDAAAAKVGRDPASIRLIAVSKQQSLEKIESAISQGQRCFGENYVQDLQKKAAHFDGQALEWHFIGHLQRNKVKEIVQSVAWIHSIDSAKLARAIQQRATFPIRALIEVNLGHEADKHGVAPKSVVALLTELADFPRVQVRGLMCIPPQGDETSTRHHFQTLAALAKQINDAACYPVPLQELSMGMSNDFEIAIEEGATMVRIGTALFGSRDEPST